MVGVHIPLQFYHPTCGWHVESVADCLSHYYESDYLDDEHPDHEFVSAETKLDPDTELLPVQQYVELHSAVARQSCRLAEQVEQRMLDSDQMNNRTSDSA